MAHFSTKRLALVGALFAFSAPAWARVPCNESTTGRVPQCPESAALEELKTQAGPDAAVPPPAAPRPRAVQASPSVDDAYAANRSKLPGGVSCSGLAHWFTNGAQGVGGTLAFHVRKDPRGSFLEATGVLTEHDDRSLAANIRIFGDPADPKEVYQIHTDFQWRQSTANGMKVLGWAQEDYFLDSVFSNPARKVRKFKFAQKIMSTETATILANAPDKNPLDLRLPITKIEFECQMVP